MKKVILFLLLCASAQALIAQTGDVATSGDLTLLASSLPEAKLIFTHRFIFPFMQGESPLTSGNNVAVALNAEVSPVSLFGAASATWTPIAFFQLQPGIRLGAGWPLELFGSDLYGSGINRDNGSGLREYNGTGFDGLIWRAHLRATFQMDLAALMPGDWNHVVMQTSHEIYYRGYSRAQGNESWYVEADAGENINGFNYYGSLLVGYQMPIFLNTVALLTEADLFLYDMPNRTQWGDNLTRWTFSVVLGFTITEQFSANLITQFRTYRNFNEGYEKNDNLKEIYYRNRHLNTSDPLKLDFFRVALALTYKFY
jgi:hypothetical protein